MSNHRPAPREHCARPTTARNDIDAALAALSADALREVVREMLPALDDKARGSVINSLIQRAARGGSGWAPAAPSDDEVDEALTFTEAAEQIGQADPSEVDKHLRRASSAFLRRDYSAAHRIFGAVLRPIGDGGIDLGQHEMVDEVLSTDTTECAAQYVVSTYMLSPPAERAAAVRAAIGEVQGLYCFWSPIQELERAAVEALPGIEDFLPAWRTLIAQKPANERNHDWDTEEDRWLREVVQRMDGTEGLAERARSTRRVDDLRAWCKSLVDAGAWETALASFEEAAELVADKDYTQGEFLDGAALAAQNLGREDLPAHLERAWRASPSMPRLRRWLGSSSSKATFGARAVESLAACPQQAAAQRALLHVLTRDFTHAAKLLATAPGLGWSSGEHPGHLLFPLFARLLGDRRKQSSSDIDPLSHRVDLEALGTMTSAQDEPRLVTPEVDVLCELAGIDDLPEPTTRATVLSAMKEAAERRAACVTEAKRRRHYRHVAELVATCVACDKAGETARWAAALKANYRRFPALRDELDRTMGMP